MDKQTIDVSNKLAGNVTSVHDQLRKEGLNKLDGGDLGGGSKSGAGDDSNSRDRVVEDGGLSSHPLGGVGDVFSHEWEVQTEHNKKRSDSYIARPEEHEMELGMNNRKAVASNVEVAENNHHRPRRTMVEMFLAMMMMMTM